jgi:hypothetical protein
MRRLLLAAGAFALAVLPGCAEPVSRVYGKVKYNGKPLPGATVVLMPPNNRTYPAITDQDGNYEISGVGRGQVRVAVQVPPPPPAARPQPGQRGWEKADAFARGEVKSDDAGKKARPVAPVAPPTPAGPAKNAIPAQYGDPSTSGLSFELKEANQEYSFDLK